MSSQKQQDQQESEIKAKKQKSEWRRNNVQHYTLDDLAKKYMDGIVIPCLNQAINGGRTAIIITMIRNDFLNCQCEANIPINVTPSLRVKMMIEKWIKCNPSYEGLHFAVFNDENFTTKFWLKIK